MIPAVRTLAHTVGRPLPARLARRAMVTRPVGEWGPETGQPGPDPAGLAAMARFIDGKPPSFVTDVSYRMAAFAQGDVGPKDGKLDLDELKALLKDLPTDDKGTATLAEIDVELLFHAADTNKDGVLEFSEFVNLFERSK